MRWHCVIFKLSLFVVLALLLANPAAARGNTTSGIYPGTLRDVCVGDTIFIGETGLNLTPLTPYASGTVIALRKFENDDPGLAQTAQIDVKHSNNFKVDSDAVNALYGTYYPVDANGNVLTAYPIYIQASISNYPQNVVIKSTKDWVIADGTDNATLTIGVGDGAQPPNLIPNVNLVLGASPPWSLQDSALTTNGNQKVRTLLLPTTKSGSAIITATATVPGVTTAPVTASFVQKIDAGPASTAITLYPQTATVGSPIRISVLVEDRYGNPVTSRRAVTNVSFFTAASGTGVFPDGMGNRLKAISVPLNETGWAEVTYLMATKQGDNFVYITPPAPLSSSLIDIKGIGDSKPFSISQSVNPAGDPPFIPADSSSQATIDYYLFDQWGNPSTDQGIQIVTSAGENRIFFTNQEGRATILYGPKLTAGFYSITATAVMNSSVRIFQTLQFGSLDPDNMLLTASPQTMASLDVNPSMVGQVIAKVIDEKGNPVKGQSVSFWIGKSDNSTYIQTKDPVIGSRGVTTSNISDPLSVNTDENGQAILDYYPGAFPVYPNADWSATAQGTTTVNASWEGPAGTVDRFIDLSYKNYPFLSVYTEVNPKTVQTGELVDVSVRLKGDGWALQPKPIDVVLCTDRSATMLYNESVIPFPTGKLVVESLDDRMVDAMNAANTFVGQTSGQDRIGLVTFGAPSGGIAILYNTSVNPGNNSNWWKNKDKLAFRAGKDYTCNKGKDCQDPSNQDSTDDKAYVDAHYPGHWPAGKDYHGMAISVDSPLTPDKSQVRTAINSTVPAGGTPMREAIYESVKQLINNRRDGAVQAIILLTDGNWDMGGDPQGIYADCSITTGRPLFCHAEPYRNPDGSSAIGPGGHDGPGTGSVITWAKDNGIKIFTIALGSELNKDELRAYATETGGKYNETASSSQLGSIYMEIAGELKEEASVDTQVSLDFTNMEVNGTYTLPGNTVFKYEFLPPKRSTLIAFIAPNSPALTSVVNSTTDWANGQFNFSAGIIKVNQEWVVNFTLRALTEGNIRVLSSKKSSKITFKGTEGEVGIPDTYITAIPPGTEKGPEGIVFEIENLNRTNPDDTEIAHLEWEPKYNGFDNWIDWTISLAPRPSDSFGLVDNFNEKRGWSPFYNLNIGDLKPGPYRVKVRGHVNDATDAVGYVDIVIPGPATAPQILIQ